jgi:hypothetical protein
VASYREAVTCEAPCALDAKPTPRVVPCRRSHAANAAGGWGRGRGRPLANNGHAVNAAAQQCQQCPGSPSCANEYLGTLVTGTGLKLWVAPPRAWRAGRQATGHCPRITGISARAPRPASHHSRSCYLKGARARNRSRSRNHGQETTANRSPSRSPSPRSSRSRSRSSLNTPAVGRACFGVWGGFWTSSTTPERPHTNQ